MNKFCANFIHQSSDGTYYVITHSLRVCLQVCVCAGGDICCLCSYLNTLHPIFFKLSTNVYDHNVSAKESLW